MQILFIHGNYPAQFRHLISAINNEKNEVIFLTARKDAEKEKINNIRIKNFETHRSANENTHHYLKDTEHAIIQGQAVIRSINELVNEGFIPDIVITHGGMGLGLFIKDVLPNTIHIGYFEWYFQPNTSKYLVKEYNIDTQLKIGVRNMPILMELDKCDKCIAPTEWQRSQFPTVYRSKIDVIFDGIDENFFFKERSNQNKDIKVANRATGEIFEISKENTLLSYATRGMETIRCFPQFMRTLPKLLEENELLIVLIAGIDRRAYSYEAPIEGGSWKEYMMKELGTFKGKERILFTGLLDYNDYREVLWRSNLHCYFTEPYVTSWSLFEAGMCGAHLAINANGATDYVLEEGTASIINMEDKNKTFEGIKKGLYSKEKTRSKIKGGFTLKEALKNWGIYLNNSLKNRNSE